MSGPFGAAAAPGPPVAPVAAPGNARLGTLSRILIGYGVIGLIAAVIAAILLLFAFVRVTNLSNQLNSQVGGVSAVLDKTANALEDASTTAASFVTTVDSAQQTVTSAAADIRQIVPRLRDLEDRANEISILGQQPLSRLGSLFGEIATYLTDIATQMDQMAKSLVGNRSALEANAASLGELATEIRTLSDTLGSDQLASAISDIRWLILALLILAAVGAAVPAAGALIAGWWLRDWLTSQAPPAAAAPAGPF
ncbi:MAG TPA: hypothetical protein VH440_00945 [Candidatus Limnocylindrales bacterium]